MPITFLDEEDNTEIDDTSLISSIQPKKRKVTFLDEEPEEEVGTLQGIANTAQNALDSSQQALLAVGGVDEDQAKKISELEYAKQARKAAPGYAEYQKAEGWDAVGAFLKNPVEVTTNIIGEGLAGSLPALGAGVATGAVGAAVGSVVPGLGTGIGYTAGQVAGTFGGSLSTEYGSKILEELQNSGMDITDPNSVQSYFSDEEKLAPIRDKALARGVPIAAFDAVSAGIGGKLGRVFGSEIIKEGEKVLGKKFATKTGEALTELGAQAVLGGGGSVAGSVAAGEEVDLKDVFAEVIGEVGTGSIEVLQGKIADRANQRKLIEAKANQDILNLSETLEQNNAPQTARATTQELAKQLSDDLNVDREEEAVELADLGGQTLKKINEVKAETQTATTKGEVAANLSEEDLNTREQDAEKLVQQYKDAYFESQDPNDRAKAVEFQGVLDAIQAEKQKRKAAPAEAAAPAEPKAVKPLPTDYLPTETPGATYGRESEIYDAFANVPRKTTEAVTTPTAEEVVTPTTEDITAVPPVAEAATLPVEQAPLTQQAVAQQVETQPYATQEIIQPEGVRQEPQDGTQIQPTTERIARHRVFNPEGSKEKEQIESGVKLKDAWYNREINNLSSLSGLSNQSVHSVMLPGIQNSEVLKSIVTFIPVDVMNDLRVRNIPADELLNNPDMLRNTLSSDSNNDIFRGVVSALGSGVTGLRTELLGRLGRNDLEGAAALIARFKNPSSLASFLAQDDIPKFTSTIPAEFTNALSRAASRGLLPVGSDAETISTNFARLFDLTEHSDKLKAKFKNKSISNRILSPATSQEEGQVTPVVSDLQSVASNTSTPEQITKLSQSGLVDIVKGQPVINEDGQAALTQAQAPLPVLTPEERRAEIEATTVGKVNDQVGARVKSAAFVTPDNTVYYGASHLDAMEQAKNAGKITQQDIDVRQSPVSRETPEFGFKTDSQPFVTRNQAEGVARKSGQLLTEKPATGQMHSNEVALDEFPKATQAISPTTTSIPSTGKPFEFFSVRNKEKAPRLGTQFGQDIEPSGKYISQSTPGAAKNLDARFEKGSVRFENPLVVEFGGGYGTPTNWKNVLSSQYGGKTGLKLTKAIRDAGYDGIVTIEPSKGPNRPAYTSEIVDIRSIKSKVKATPSTSTTPAPIAETPAVTEAPLPVAEPTVKISRSEDFSMTGDYNVSIGDKKHRIYRDSESGYWYDADVRDNAVKNNDPAQGSPSLGLLTTETKKDAIAELVNKYKKEQQASISETPIVTEPTPAVSETITPVAPTGPQVGQRVRSGSTPQPFVITEVTPQTARDVELGEQYYQIKNERTGEASTVESVDITPIKTTSGSKKLKSVYPSRGGVEPTGAIQVKAGVSPTMDTEYLAAVESGDMETAQRMVDEAAKKEGYDIGPVWHGSPDFIGNEFDLNMRGRRGLSRGGFSFTRNKDAAEAYMKSGVDTSQKLVDDANALMKELQSRVDAGLEWNGPYNEVDVPFFRSDSVDDIDLFQSYISEISNTLPSDLKLIANELAGRTSPEDYTANPRLIRAFLKQPKTIDISGKELLLAESPSQIKSADPVTYDDAGNVIPLSQRFNQKTPDIRYARARDKAKYRQEYKSAEVLTKINNYIKNGFVEMKEAGANGDTELIEEISKKIKFASKYNINESELYSEKELEDGVRNFFKGSIPSNVIFTNDIGDDSYASYVLNTGEIEINRAYFKRNVNIDVIIGHELGHFAFGDPEFQKIFTMFWDDLTQEQRDAISKYVEENYSELTPDLKNEEKVIRAWQALLEQNPEIRSKWANFVEAVKRFLNKYFSAGYEVNDSDKFVLNILNAIRQDFISGKKMLREDGSDFKLQAKAQVHGQKEAGRELESFIGGEKIVQDIVRQNYFDSTQFNDENTQKAYDLLQSLTDFTNNNNNDFATKLNEDIQSKLKDQDVHPDIKQVIGVVILRNELQRYSNKLIIAGDSFFEKRYKLNANDIPLGIKDVTASNIARALGAIAKINNPIIGAIQAQGKGEVVQLASTTFGTKEPSTEQIKAIEEALKESDKAETIDNADILDSVVSVEEKVGVNIRKDIDATIKKSGVKPKTIDDVIGSTETGKTEFAGVDASTAKASIKKQATSPIDAQAERAIEGLAKLQSDVQAWPNKTQNQVRSIVQQDLRQRPDMARKEAWKSLLTSKLMNAGVSESNAMTLSDLIWKQHEINNMNREIKLIESAAENGSLGVIVEMIKNTPLQQQSTPEWRKLVIRQYLMSAGLSEKQAESASRLYDNIIAEKIAEAKQKAFEDSISKTSPWRDHMSRNGQLAKDALKKVLNAVRTSALDPTQNTESIIAKQNGWTGFSEGDFRRIAEIDEILNNDKTDELKKAELMKELNEIISKTKLPVTVKQALAAFYTGQALMGIPTALVNFFSPAGFAIRNLITDIGRFALTDPSRIPIAFDTFLDSMRSWYNQTKYAFKNEVYPNDVVEYLNGNNVLKELYNKGKKEWKNGDYASGMRDMLVGMTQITGRVLSALDQGAISALENQAVNRYAMEAMSLSNIPSSKRNAVARQILQAKRNTYASLIAGGMEKERAGVLADMEMKEQIKKQLSSLNIETEKVNDVINSAINDALLSVGRNRTISMDGLINEQKRLSDDGMISYLPIKFLEQIASSSAQQGPLMQIFSKMLYGFALVPARAFHNAAWYSPYGFLRIFRDKYQKSKGMESSYSLSLGNELQYRQRLTESIAGSLVMLGLGALVKSSTDDEDDDKFKIVVTGNGPDAAADKQYYDSWIKKWKPYSIHIVMGDTVIPINIGRGGEAIFFPILIAGAKDDWKIRNQMNKAKKKPADLNQAAVMLGSTFLALAQRGPYAAFGKSLFNANRAGQLPEEVASQAGYFGKTFIPIVGTSLARNISDFINDPIDRSSMSGAIYSNIPIVGPMIGTKALNAFGQPIRADDWGDKLFKLGVPMVFSFPKNTPMNALNELVLSKGDGPTIPTRRIAESRLERPMTNEEFYAYVKTYGDSVSKSMFRSRKSLERMDASRYQSQLEEYSKDANERATRVVKRMSMR
jgi:hypothetical protein